MRVPLFDITRQTEALLPELMRAVERTLRSGAYVLGPDVERFEREFAAYVGARHAIGVASGTDAITLALRAAGVGPGDFVLTSPFSFFATASAILQTGARPAFADIDPETLTIAPSKIGDVLEGRCEVARRLGVGPDAIKAILPVHLFGRAAPVDRILELARPRGIAVIEDACQALGTELGGGRAGALATAGCFSFFPTKNVGAFGDGGLVTLDDDALAERIRLLRAHGSRDKGRHEIVGTNSRLDALQAALLSVKLAHAEAWIERRRAHAAFYDERLASLRGVTAPGRDPRGRHTYHQYTVRAPRVRDALRDHLEAEGIGTAIHYGAPIHLQPALASEGYRPGDFPEAERAATEVLSLPMFPELTEAERAHVADATHRFFHPDRPASR